jgi:hypothetical protein
VAHGAKELTVFQRTPNFVLPARNHPLTEDQQNAIKDSYEEVWEGARNQSFGMAMTDSKLTMNDMKSKEQHRRILEYGWEIGEGSLCKGFLMSRMLTIVTQPGRWLPVRRWWLTASIAPIIC